MPITRERTIHNAKYPFDGTGERRERRWSVTSRLTWAACCPKLLSRTRFPPIRSTSSRLCARLWRTQVTGATTNFRPGTTDRGSLTYRRIGRYRHSKHWKSATSSKLGDRLATATANHRERKCAQNCNKWHIKLFFLKLQSAFWQFRTIRVFVCCLIKLFSYILFEKYIDILALEMASPGNQHCASCIVPYSATHKLQFSPLLHDCTENSPTANDLSVVSYVLNADSRR